MFLEQRINLPFCVRLVETCTELYKMFKIAYSGEDVSRIQAF